MKAVELSAFGDGLLSLPNSVAVMNEREIVVADGGSNSIKVLASATGELLREVGAFGIGELKFKEPVGAFVSPAGHVYVMDWHNHRVVVLDSQLTYVREFGHFGETAGIGNLGWRNLVALLRSFAAPGSYIPSHFSPDQGTGRVVSRAHLVRNVLEGVAYFLRKGIKRRMVGDMQMNKPNGVAFSGDFVFVTAKNLRMVFKVHLASGKVVAQCGSPTNGRRFGRLGNVCVSPRSGRVFVCDQPNQTIWILDDELNYLDSLGPEAVGGEYWPFAMCFLSGDIIAVTDNETFLVIDEGGKRVLHRSGPVGEPHGIDYCRASNVMFVADRLNGRVRRFHLEGDTGN